MFENLYYDVSMIIKSKKNEFDFKMGIIDQLRFLRSSPWLTSWQTYLSGETFFASEGSLGPIRDLQPSTAPSLHSPIKYVSPLCKQNKKWIVFTNISCTYTILIGKVSAEIKMAIQIFVFYRSMKYY